MIQKSPTPSIQSQWCHFTSIFLNKALLHLTNSFHIHFSIDSFFHKIHIRSIFTKYQHDSIWIRGHLPYLANEPSTSAAKITPLLKTNDATDGLVIIDVFRKLQKKRTISIEELISTYTVHVWIVRSASVSKRFIVYVLFKFIISWSLIESLRLSIGWKCIRTCLNKFKSEEKKNICMETFIFM